MKNVFMKRAIELAEKGKGLTSPNPCVGAVIEKGGYIVGEGWHRKAGTPHAEVVAIGSVMKKSGITSIDLDPALFQNANLYVTLEPCSHYGKTGPCTEAIIKAGFKKVCIGMKDPYKKVNGQGVKKLQRAGIEVELCGGNASLIDEIRGLNQPFIKWCTNGVPYVILKSAISLDGKIATSSGESKWITSEKTRKDARKERSLCDAVLVGAGTVKADNPVLASHGKFKNKKLLRVIVDPKLELELKYKVFRDENVLVACTSAATKKNMKRFSDNGVEFKSFGKSEVSIYKLLKYLGERDVQSLYVEGGASVNGHFLDAYKKNTNLIDKVIYYIAPKLIGGVNSLSSIGGEGVSKLKNSLSFESQEIESTGKDLKYVGIVRKY